jgi:hypothetical protein
MAELDKIRMVVAQVAWKPICVKIGSEHIRIATGLASSK